MALKYNLFCTFAKMLSFHLQTGRDLHLFILLESIVRVLWVIDLYSCYSLMSVIVWFLDFHCLHWYGIVRISHYYTIKMRTFPMLFSWWYINLENQTAITSEFLIVRKMLWRNQLFYPCYNDNNIWRLYLFSWLALVDVSGLRGTVGGRWHQKTCRHWRNETMWLFSASCQRSVTLAPRSRDEFLSLIKLFHEDGLVADYKLH